MFYFILLFLNFKNKKKIIFKKIFMNENKLLYKYLNFFIIENNII